MVALSSADESADTVKFTELCPALMVTEPGTVIDEPGEYVLTDTLAYPDGHDREPTEDQPPTLRITGYRRARCTG